MDYEKKYKETLELATKAKNNASLSNGTLRVLDIIFPELKESEDERIRKELIKYLNEGVEGYIPAGDRSDYQRWLAWVEKQSDKDKLIKELGRYKVKYIQEILSQQLEKQGEQNPVDKPEPKFKVGDWAVWDNKIPCHIDNIYQGKESLMYTITDTNNMTRSYSVKSFDNNAHLWTIEDANDGDVLLSKHNQPFIYNGIFDEESVGAYCGIDKLGNDFLVDTFSCDWSYKEGVKPTTKEQRDLLFSKMKEASYEWDEENKKPRKIVAPKFNIHDCVVKKHNSNINDLGYFIITDITGGKYWYNNRIICDVTEQDEWELFEPVRQNSATWSEEDEKIIRRIDSLLYAIHESEFEDIHAWLKSIKQRIEEQQ